MGTPVLIFPADKLQVFESTVKGIADSALFDTLIADFY